MLVNLSAARRNELPVSSRVCNMLLCGGGAQAHCNVSSNLTPALLDGVPVVRHVQLMHDIVKVFAGVS